MIASGGLAALVRRQIARQVPALLAPHATQRP
jgi:hypothetical protein